jgi:hypothetical protein
MHLTSGGSRKMIHDRPTPWAGRLQGVGRAGGLWTVDHRPTINNGSVYHEYRHSWTDCYILL